MRIAELKTIRIVMEMNVQGKKGSGKRKRRLIDEI